MAKEKRSFFERLTGTVRLDDKAASDERDLDDAPSRPLSPARTAKDDAPLSWMDAETEEEGELTIDVYQTADSIVVKSMIAGVRPEDLDISITRDLVTIRGKREEERLSADGDYLVRELYWGSFSRTIELPEEIDVDESEAIEKHGLLILRLPKLDKKRQSKLKVKTA